MKKRLSLLAVATVDDLYYWDPWTVRDAFAVIGSLAYRGFPSCIVGYIFHMGCILEARKWAFMSFPRLSATMDGGLELTSPRNSGLSENNHLIFVLISVSKINY